MKEKETIEYLDLKHLVPFRNHPFKLRDGEEKEQSSVLFRKVNTRSYRDTGVWRFAKNSVWKRYLLSSAI